MNNATKCKPGCKYYSATTKSCDYRLVTHSGRGCEAGKLCTRYENGAKDRPRTWRINYAKENPP